ncbi:glycosyltransferase [Butyrivibrio sp. JL13D10]|uniref:glycosyltransferase n=1 Tax=Butyrivibrio sp. JL13D10 TaxID=3236815 RepID=UPI0038B45BC9
MGQQENLLISTIVFLLTSDELNIGNMLDIGHDITSGKYADSDLLYVKGEVEKKVGNVMMGSTTNPLLRIGYLQLLLLLEQTPENFIRFVDAIGNEKIDVSERYGCWAQSRGLMFVIPSLYSKESYKHYLDTYKVIVEEYLTELNINLSRIPFNNRNHELIIFMTQNFLGIAHGPTKSCFYRAKTLKNLENKEIFIFNTNDLAPFMMRLPLFWEYYQNEKEELSEIDYLVDGNTKIPYFQAEVEDRPNMNSMIVILETIAELRPEMIINIGGFNPTASIANIMIPVVLVGLAPGQLQYDGTDYFTYSLELTDDVVSYAEYLGTSKNALIPSVFTSDLKEQTEHHTRKELGLPENKMIGCIIGGRLDLEIDAEFIEFLIGLEDIFIVFWGKLEKYEEICERYPKLKDMSLYGRMVGDMLSHLELCDIYINPKRRGGGTSSVEAMSKGVVPVALDFGDVAYNVGKEFTLGSYDEMSERIRRLKDDKGYYSHMSEKAKSRANYLCDTAHRFIDIVHDVERRMQEQAEKEYL